MTEEIIVKKLLATPEKDTRINLHRYPISIAMQNADLILAGEMESVAAKKIALVAAAETIGVHQIVDRLRVTTAEKMGDAEIRDHVCKVLLGGTGAGALSHPRDRWRQRRNGWKSPIRTCGLDFRRGQRRCSHPKLCSAEPNAQTLGRRARLVGTGNARCCEWVRRSAGARRQRR